MVRDQIYDSYPEAISAEPSDTCPMHSTHEKLLEASYFIMRMVAEYHEPRAFRFNASAFFQAARSVTMMMQKELKHHPGFDEWYKTVLRPRLKKSTTLKTLNEIRVEVVHKKAFLPTSSATIGILKHKRLKLGITIPIDPMISKLEAILMARSASLGICPHRGDIGEEAGLRREWRLDSIAELEVCDFAVMAWNELSEAVTDAHRFVGIPILESSYPRMDPPPDHVRTLGESDLFPEVLKAWEDPPEDVVTAVAALNLIDIPSPDGKTIHSLAVGETAIGWVGGTGQKHWDHAYRSMLLYQLNGAVVDEGTCVFFEAARAELTHQVWSE